MVSFEILPLQLIQYGSNTHNVINTATLLLYIYCCWIIAYRDERTDAKRCIVPCEMNTLIKTHYLTAIPMDKIPFLVDNRRQIHGHYFVLCSLGNDIHMHSLITTATLNREAMFGMQSPLFKTTIYIYIIYVTKILYITQYEPWNFQHS